eukprot:1467462-Amphidinium_carterae.1
MVCAESTARSTELKVDRATTCLFLSKNGAVLGLSLPRWLTVPTPSAGRRCPSVLLSPVQCSHGIPEDESALMSRSAREKFRRQDQDDCLQQTTAVGNCSSSVQRVVKILIL